MGRELFGTDGVRGVSGEYPLDKEGTVAIGRAVGMHFAHPGESIVIGWDTRESSADIVDNISAGLNQAGVNVIKAGVIPTPGLAYVTGHGDFVAGVMITASHNPYQYNGVKVFDKDGQKLSDETESRLNQLIESGVEGREQGTITDKPELVKTYEDFLVQSATGSLAGVRLAIDAANGAASGLAERVFARLGADTKALFDQPDGKNINDGCGATDTALLQTAVKSESMDMGIALDGDADRLIMVDEQGREVKGDYLLYILAVSGNHKGVVATVMSNLGFEQALQAKGIELVRTDVGDRYVLEGLERTGFKLGGEQSGHVVLVEKHTTGDGLLAAVAIAEAVRQSGKTLAQWCDEVPLVPQALVNIQIDNKKVMDQPEVRQFVASQQQALGEEGRLLIRPSGTEPLVRVMVEAPDAEIKAQNIANELGEIIK